MQVGVPVWRSVPMQPPSLRTHPDWELSQQKDNKTSIHQTSLIGRSNNFQNNCAFGPARSRCVIADTVLSPRSGNPQFLSFFLLFSPFLLWFVSNSWKLFLMCLFNQQFYSHALASGGPTICHLRETRGTQLRNPVFEEPPSWKSLMPSSSSSIVAFLAAIWGVWREVTLKPKITNWVPDHRGDAVRGTMWKARFGPFVPWKRCRVSKTK